MALEITNLTLAYLVEELRPVLEGSFVNKVQAIDQTTIRLRLHTRTGTRDLVANQSALFLTKYMLQPQQKKSNFAELLRAHLSNRRILGISQHNLDRVVALDFGECKLIFEFFSHSNIILTDSSLKIIAVQRRESWRDRTLAPREQYVFPKPKGANPLEVSAKELSSAFSKSISDAVRTLVSCVNIAPEIAEEALLLAGIPKAAPAKSLSGRQVAALHSALRSLYGAKRALQPLVAGRLLLPFPTGSLQGQSAASLSDALDEHCVKQLVSKDVNAKLDAVGQKLSKEQHNLAQQLEAAERFRLSISQNTAAAELIYANFQAFDTLLREANSLFAQKLPSEQILGRLNKLASSNPELAKLCPAMDMNTKNRTLTLEIP